MLLRHQILLLFVVAAICTIFGLICEDAKQCEGFEIDSPEVALCYGFKACLESRINTISPIYCDGGEGCLDSDLIESNNNIECSGYGSCKQSIHIISHNSTVQCLGALSCSLTYISASNEMVLCGGLDSCIRSDINTKNIQCLGQKSCQQTFNIGIQENTYCDGDESCLFSTFSSNYIYCRGAESCSKTNLIAADILYAYGTESVSISNINAKQIYGYGHKALYKSKIDSNPQHIIGGIINIDAFGFETGDKAVILCRNNTKCTLNCKGNACNNMEFLCLKGSDCIITPNECMKDAGDTVNFIKCPLFSNSTTMEDDELLLDRFNTQQTEDDPLDDDDDNEEKTNLNEDIYHWKECDDAFECVERIFTKNDTDVICLGYYGCAGAYIDYVDDIQCFGYKSCINATRIYTDGSRSQQLGVGHGTGKGYIKCESTKSCYNANIIRAEETVYCRGLLSCSYVPLIYSKEGAIKCDGIESCSNSNLNALIKINCDGYHSCSNIHGTSTMIQCAGPESCKSSVLYAATSIICYGYRSCGDSSINTKIFRAYSYYDAMESLIIADIIYGYGYGSLAFSSIDSGDTVKKIRVFSYGYHSGYGTQIICRSGSTCILNCEFSGCYNLYFYCYYGSQCIVSQTGCNFHAEPPSNNKDVIDYSISSDHHYNVTSINGTICPYWIYDESNTKTDDINIHREYMKNNRKYDEEYIKIMNQQIIASQLHDEHEEKEDFDYEFKAFQNRALNNNNNVIFIYHSYGSVILIILFSLFVFILYKYIPYCSVKHDYLNNECTPLMTK